MSKNPAKNSTAAACRNRPIANIAAAHEFTASARNVNMFGVSPVAARPLTTYRSSHPPPSPIQYVIGLPRSCSFCAFSFAIARKIIQRKLSIGYDPRGMSSRAPSLNAVFTKRSERRRYEVWFLRLGLTDGSGAWWFRYLLLNPGQDGCAGNPRGMPAQIWATWF